VDEFDYPGWHTSSILSVSSVAYALVAMSRITAAESSNQKEI
jgi:hypothetical protein